MTAEADPFDPDPVGATEPAGAVRAPTIDRLPSGYSYGVTRYADIILQRAFPTQFDDLVTVLGGFRIKLEELRAGGGARTAFVRRFDAALESHGWGERGIKIGKTIDDERIATARGHKIDMFSVGTTAQPYPGVAVEMEWNNKDPFFDRDLLSYQALHREGALGVGVIVTRGQQLQGLLERTVLHMGERTSKYGRSSTHWQKLLPRVDPGGGGECPLLLIGIEPPRVDGVEQLERALERLHQADHFKASWRSTHSTWSAAEAEWSRLVARAHAVLDE